MSSLSLPPRVTQSQNGLVLVQRKRASVCVYIPDIQMYNSISMRAPVTLLALTPMSALRTLHLARKLAGSRFSVRGQISPGQLLMGPANVQIRARTLWQTRIRGFWCVVWILRHAALCAGDLKLWPASLIATIQLVYLATTAEGWSVYGVGKQTVYISVSLIVRATVPVDCWGQRVKSHNWLLESIFDIWHQKLIDFSILTWSHF